MTEANLLMMANQSLNQTQLLSECPLSYEAVYCGLFQNRLSKLLAMTLSVSLLVFDMAMVQGLIWYEHYGTDNNRTLMNKLFASVCWVVFAQDCFTMLDNFRYWFGPLPQSFCLLLILAKIIGNSMILLFYDAILITKYILIFKLKNPGALYDEFWCRYLNIWICMASIIYDCTRYILPGKPTFSFFTCSGTIPGLDQERPKRGSNMVETLSLILYIAITVRILVHKKVTKIAPLKESTTLASNFRNYILTDLDQTTIASLTSNFFVVFFLALYFYMFLKLRAMSYQDYNVYPNYLYLYFHQLLWTPFFTFGACALYYTTHAPLRNTVIRELKSQLGLEKSTWITCN